jgi:hypothetical protein
MISITDVFLKLVAVGIALPCTVILIFNFIVSLKSSDNYTLDLKKMGIMYLLALLGWAIVFGVEVR